MSLNLQTKDEVFRQTVLEYIQTVSGELPIDAVGLWQIVPAGRQGFKLNGDDLTEFVHRCVFALLESGAKPVVGGNGTAYDWIIQTQYGDTNERIVGAVVEEWLAFGGGGWGAGGLWFGLPSPYRVTERS